MLYCTEGRSLSSLLRETAGTEAFTASYSQFPRPEHPVTRTNIPIPWDLGFVFQNTCLMNMFNDFQDLTFKNFILDLEMMVG